MLLLEIISSKIKYKLGITIDEYVVIRGIPCVGVEMSKYKMSGYFMAF